MLDNKIKYCPHCGKMMLDDCNFCSHCGFDFSSDIFFTPHSVSRKSRSTDVYGDYIEIW